jgi:hypothetical protein
LAVLRALAEIWPDCAMDVSSVDEITDALMGALAKPPADESVPLPDWLNQDLAALRDRCRGDEGARVPHPDSTLRVLGVTGEDLRARDLSNIQRIFNELEAGPHARRLRGRIYVTFPSVDSDPRPNYLIPEVRAFLSALHAARPHFFYYLPPGRSAGVIGLHLFALLPLDQLTVDEDGRTTPNSPLEEWARFVAGHLLPAARFSHAVGDDVGAFLAAVAQNFAPDLWRAIIADMRARDASTT